MQSWKSNRNCYRAEIHSKYLTVVWRILTLDYDPNDEYWCMRDDPRPYTYWTDTYEAEIYLRGNRNSSAKIQVEGKDAANALWKFLKTASLQDIVNKYGREVLINKYGRR